MNSPKYDAPPEPGDPWGRDTDNPTAPGATSTPSSASGSSPLADFIAAAKAELLGLPDDES